MAIEKTMQTISMPKPINTNAEGNTYYPWFDYLRAVCAITVMLYHDQAIPWSNAGNFAVQVFFSLSGWLIGGILLKTEKQDLYRFYFNRAIRIWTPYYFAIFLLLTLSVAREPITSKWIEIVIYKITFVYNLFGTSQLAQFNDAMPQKGTLNHVWSVNAEEQFYLLAPILLVLFARNVGRSTALWTLLAILGLIFNTYPAIILGVLAAIITSKSETIHLHRNSRALLFATTLILIPTLANEKYYNYTSPFASIAIVLLLAVPGKAKSLGSLLGGMSYPLYLNHWVGIFALNFLLPETRHTITNWLLMSILNIVFASTLYWAIDRELLQRRKKWYSESRGKYLMLFTYALVTAGITYGLWKSQS